MSTFILSYVIIILVIAFVISCIWRDQKRQMLGCSGRDGDGELYGKGRSDKKDNVGNLLDRIEWSTYLEKRLAIWQRIFIMSVIIELLIIFLIIRCVPPPGTALLLLILIFVPIWCTHHFMYVHGDAYNDYYITQNVRKVRKKLGYVRQRVCNSTSSTPSLAQVMVK